MKKFYTFLIVSAIIAASAFAVAPRFANTVKAPERVKLTPEQRKAKLAGKTPAFVKGGADGSKQLYGVLGDNYGDLFFEYGPSVVTVGDDGYLGKVFDLNYNPTSGCYFTRDNMGFVMSVSYDSVIYYDIFNAETGVKSWGWNYTTSSPNVYPCDLAFDPQTKRVYGFFIDDARKSLDVGPGKLGYIDVENLAATVAITYVGALDEAMRALAFDAGGQLWGIGFDNKLYKINKVNSAITEVCNLSLSDYLTDVPGVVNQESAEFDWETGDLYFSASEENDWYSVILKINTTTGAIQEVGNFGDTYDLVTGIFFKQQPQKSAGPAAVSDLTIKAVGVELKAELEFDLPSLDTDGGALSGTVDWTVSDGENTLANGSGAPGAHIKAEATVTEGGMTSFSVIASQNGVDSAPVLIQTFIGCDTPEIYGIPDVYPDGSEATIVWEAALPVNLGNLAPVTYRVVRQPDNFVVAEAAVETQVTDKLPTEYKNCYTYEVTPVSGTVEGKTVTSRRTYIGSIFSLPHENNFDDEALFNQYPAIDGNKDGKTWMLNSDRKAAEYPGVTATDADDYMCIGPFDMVKGNTYTVYITASAHTGVNRFEVKAGTNASDASSFTTTVISEVVVNPLSVEFVNKIGTFEPEATGRYYIAVHATSPYSAKGLWINNVKVTGVSASMPGATDLTAQPTATGCTLTYTLPTKNHIGDAAANVTSAHIYRDNTLIAEITEGIADGATLTYIDTPDPALEGKHTYAVSAVNADGEGLMTTKEVYLGPDYPNAPRDLRVYEDLNTPGLIHLTWSAPVDGANGGYIDPATVTYTVDWSAPTSGLKNVGKATSFTYQIPAEMVGQQDVMAFTVKSYNNMSTLAGKSSETRSAYYGNDYKLPLIESWSTGASSTGIWAGEAVVYNPEIAESWWELIADQSQDGDDYSRMVSTTVPGGGYRLRSPRVTLEGAANPTLVFYVYYTANAKDLYVEAAVDDKPMTKIYDVTIDPAKAETWQRVEISLADYKDSKRIQFGFTGHGVAAGENFAGIDNVNILDKFDNDLMVVEIAANDKVMLGDKATVGVIVRNTGFTAVKGGDYTLRLMKNGKEIDSQEGEDMNPFEETTVRFTDTPLPTDADNAVYSVSIDYAADENTDNNTSRDVTVKVAVPDYPAPTDLKAENAAGVKLTWVAPAAEAMPKETVTETFDKYEAFVTSGFGDWKTIDVDGAPTVIAATSLGILNYPHIGEPMAWQVMDPEKAMFLDGAWYARSGKQMLVSMQACVDNTRQKQSEDWLISPELCGDAQKISFYARAGLNAASPEVMDIYVSSTGTEIKDFKLLESNVNVPYAKDWQEYNYNLPAGTKYFAIVHKSYDKFALLVDDITYAPAGSKTVEMALEGYNIYRDGALLASVSANATSYVDKAVEKDAKYTYHVTALWDKGESGVSNAAEISAEAGLDMIATANITITAGDGAIIVAGADGLTIAVYNTMGRTVAMTTGKEVTRIQVPAPGIYVVRAGQTVSKVLVK